MISEIQNVLFTTAYPSFRIQIISLIPKLRFGKEISQIRLRHVVAREFTLLHVTLIFGAGSKNGHYAKKERVIR